MRHNGKALRHVQARFRVVYGTQTFSNNNTWLRRKLLEGESLKGPFHVEFLPAACY